MPTSTMAGVGSNLIQPVFAFEEKQIENCGKKISSLLYRHYKEGDG
jgi:hypothetical protein